jgi:hypothetical protein
MSVSRSTAPEAVMAKNLVTAQDVKSVNRNLFFYMQFKFYKFDRHAAYEIENDNANVNYRGTDDTSSATSTDRSRIVDREASENNTRATIQEYLRHPLSTVIMPLPPELYEQYAVKFEQAGLGLVGRTLLDSVINGGYDFGGIEEDARRAGSQAINTLPQLAEGIPGLGSAQEVFDIARQKILNPVYTTVFRGVNIRTHDFSWKIVPESPAEQADVEGVLNALRRHSLPAFERSGEINNIMYPDFCKIELTPAVFKFPKPMFVSSLSINHAPEGIPAFYRDMKPVGYEIKMSLTEATALTQDDIVDVPEEAQTT